MKYLLPFVAGLLCLLTGCSQPESADHPVAARHSTPLTLHGETRNDPYYYLADRGHPDTRQYIQDEQAYLAKHLADFSVWQSEYQQRVSHWLSDALRGIPVYLDGYWYERRVKPGGQYAVFERWQEGGPREVVLDLNELDGDGGYLAAGSFAMNGSRLAVTLDHNGDEHYQLLIRKMPTAEIELVIDDVGPSLAWSLSGNGVYYTDSTASQVFFHDLSGGATSVVYQERDAAFGLSLRTDRSGRRVMLTAESHDTSEIMRIKDQQTETPLAPRQPGHIYRVITAGDGRLWLLTNLRDKTFALALAEYGAASTDEWAFLDLPVPGTIRDYELIDEQHLALLTTEKLTESVFLLDTKTGLLDEVFASDTGELRLISSAPNTIRFAEAGPLTPETGYEYELSSELLKALNRSAGERFADYQAETRWVPATAGQLIPVTIIRRRDEQSEPRPLLLQAYGAYGLSLSRRFDPARMPYLEKGFVYAIAHIRGGGELGEPWHAAARRENKTQTFDDFDAVVNFLIDEGIADPEQVFARGRSAGGTVMGVAINRAPTRYRGVIAEVPFVDVLTTLSEGEHRLSAAEYLEWGDPDELPIFQAMKSYSPYDNVQPSNLPAMLVRVDLDDARVGYHEGLKWMAKLRHNQQGNAMMLLDISRRTGHLGPSDQHARLQQDALDYAFIMSQQD